MIDFLTPPKIAKALAVNPDKVLGWIRLGRLKAVNVVDPPKRPRYRVSPEALQEFLNSIAVTPAAKTPRRAAAKTYKRYV